MSTDRKYASALVGFFVRGVPLLQHQAGKLGVLRCTVLASLLLCSCGGPPSDLIGIGDAPTSTRSLRPISLFVATSRAPADDPHQLFSGERGEGVSFFRVSVFVPPQRNIGEVNRARVLPPDPQRHFVIGAAESLAGPQFVSSIDGAIDQRPVSSRGVLVFVHGFNTDLSSAILRTAQFVQDSGFEGVPVLFSWPSRGRTLDYLYDTNSALFSRRALVETMRYLQQINASGFDVLAHSMGNLLVMEAARDMVRDGSLSRKARLDSIMLASPDIDADLFREQLRGVQSDRLRIYVMVARTDRALALSRRLAGGVNRVGNDDPDALAQLGLSIVDVSEVRDSDRFRHTQFANAPEVVQLIGRHIRRTGGFEDDATAAQGVRNLVLGVATLPARIVGGGRVIVISD